MYYINYHGSTFLVEIKEIIKTRSTNYYIEIVRETIKPIKILVEHNWIIRDRHIPANLSLIVFNKTDFKKIGNGKLTNILYGVNLNE